MKYRDISETIIRLKNSDIEFRNILISTGRLGTGYNEKIAEPHEKNTSILSAIIDEIGYPTIDKVGKEASSAAWLIIQHSIGKPDFMKKCAEILKSLIGVEKEYHRNYAYLTDRIAVFEDRPQLYGTQFDWDENGELSPNRFDDLTKVNQRRKSIGLNTLEEQTRIMRRKAENQSPPSDLKRRKEEFDRWRMSTGWISRGT
jgi:hypothetical protein